MSSYNKPPYVMPGKKPAVMCGDKNPKPGIHNGFPCKRREGHGGRHAFIWWNTDKRVRAVWGERDGR